VKFIIVLTILIYLYTASFYYEYCSFGNVRLFLHPLLSPRRQVYALQNGSNEGVSYIMC
jgi:hypothetical protein